MQTPPLPPTLAELNSINKHDFLNQLTDAYQADPNAEPKACQLLRLHCAGQAKLLNYNFETAYSVQPNRPLQFAEALFVLRDEAGKPMPSMEVLRTLQTHRKDLRLDSRFRFWLGFSAVEAFFRPGSPTSAFTHLSMNIPAYAAASPHFTRRFIQGAKLFKQAHPDKGLIIEMLEHQPWNNAQRPCMGELEEHGVGWAVDDYGAPGGHHSPRSLSLATQYSSTLPPIVKLDGELLTRSLQTGDFSTLCERLHEVQRECPKALLVFEWVSNAAEAARLADAMQQGGIHMPISFIQSHGFNTDEQQKFMQRPQSRAGHTQVPT